MLFDTLNSSTGLKKNPLVLAMITDRHDILCYLFNDDNCVWLLQVQKSSSNGLKSLSRRKKNREGWSDSEDNKAVLLLGPLVSAC